MIDAQVARLLDALEKLALADNTLIVFCSDHGDFMGAHRLFTKGIPPFEEAYRVPLLISGPRLPGGVEITNIVSLLDVAPTIMALTLGQEFAGHGRSLLPLLRGETDSWDNVAYAEMHGQRFSYTQRVLWRDHYKYVFNPMDFDELYDLAADPHEMNNLANNPAYRQVLEALSERMWHISRRTGDFTLYKAEDAMYRFAPVGPRHTEAGAWK
jgi:arylsulfatase A-like enzyme